MKARINGLTLCVAVLGLATAGAFAHEHEGMGSDDMMMKVDTNHDGMISADEHAVHAKWMFDQMDANHDGMVSKAEMQAGMKMMHEQHEHMDRDAHEAMEKKEDMKDDMKKEDMEEHH